MDEWKEEKTCTRNFELLVRIYRYWTSAWRNVSPATSQTQSKRPFVMSLVNDVASLQRGAVVVLSLVTHNS